MSELFKIDNSTIVCCGLLLFVKSVFKMAFDHVISICAVSISIQTSKDVKMHQKSLHFSNMRMSMRTSMRGSVKQPVRGKVIHHIIYMQSHTRLVQSYSDNSTQDLVCSQRRPFEQSDLLIPCD